MIERVPYCPSCGKEVAADSLFCPECSAKLTQDSAPQAAGQAVQKASGPPGPTLTQRSLSALDRFAGVVPRMDDASFWMFANAFVLGYIGAWDLVFQSGNPVVSGLSVFAGLLYLLLARRRLLMPEPWIGQASLALPALVLLGDIISTGGATAFGALIAAFSVAMTFFAYRSLREAGR